jgi:ribonuclease HI
MEKYIAYTDGSCDNLHPRRPGGAAYIIFKEDGSLYKKTSKGFLNTTNNRMELLAIISVVNSLPKGSSVTIYTDSNYCILACKSKKPKKNKDLVELYHRLAGKLSSIEFHWVKGHAGNIYNEECDRMANGEYRKMLY